MDGYFKVEIEVTGVEYVNYAQAEKIVAEYIAESEELTKKLQVLGIDMEQVEVNYLDDGSKTDEEEE